MRLTRLQASNYRALAEVDLSLGPINVLFGPNGAGKSTLLDTIWFVRDCALRSVGVASSDRDHGIGLLFDGAPEGSSIVVALSTDSVRYELTLQFSGGRIEPLAGERLASIPRGETLINRLPGTSRADLYSVGLGQSANFELREPEKLSLSRYLDYTDRDEAAELDRILHFVRSYHSRSFNLYRLKKYGSDSSYETTVWTFANNLWSVLRNLESKRRLDNRYETVMGYMRKAFPRTFRGLGCRANRAKFPLCQVPGERTNATDPGIGGFRRSHPATHSTDYSLLGRQRPLFAPVDRRAGNLLAPLGLGGPRRGDDRSRRAWNKQILVATHSPVLISQFEPNQILSANLSGGRSELIRLSEIPEIQDLLDRYAAGSLFMSEMIGNQSDGEVSHGVPREQKG